MKRKTIGNDISFRWTIRRNGAAEDLTGMNAALILRDGGGRRCNVEYAFIGNVVRGTFYGKDQRNTGVYTLEIVENEGRKNQYRLDVVGAWELVLHTHEEGGSDEGGIVTDSIQFTSEISVPTNGLGIASLVTTTSDVDGEYNTLTIQMDSGSEYVWKVKNGSTGAQGATGAIPVITTSKSGGILTIYADGQKVGEVSDGEDGQDADIDGCNAAIAKANAAAASAETAATNADNAADSANEAASTATTAAGAANNAASAAEKQTDLAKDATLDANTAADEAYNAATQAKNRAAAADTAAANADEKAAAAEEAAASANAAAEAAATAATNANNAAHSARDYADAANKAADIASAAATEAASAANAANAASDSANTAADAANKAGVNADNAASAANAAATNATSKAAGVQTAIENANSAASTATSAASSANAAANAAIEAAESVDETKTSAESAAEAANVAAASATSASAEATAAAASATTAAENATSAAASANEAAVDATSKAAGVQTAIDNANSATSAADAAALTATEAARLAREAEETALDAAQTALDAADTIEPTTLIVSSSNEEVSFTLDKECKVSVSFSKSVTGNWSILDADRQVVISGDGISIAANDKYSVGALSAGTYIASHAPLCTMSVYKVTSVVDEAKEATTSATNAATTATTAAENANSSSSECKEAIEQIALNYTAIAEKADSKIEEMDEAIQSAVYTDGEGVDVDSSIEEIVEGAEKVNATLNGTTLSVTDRNGVTTSVDCKGEKGAQGNSGYQGAAGELEVVNNLTDGGATAALSAEMGKELNEQIENIENTTTTSEDDVISFDSDDGQSTFAYIDSNGIHAKNIYDFDGNKYNRSCKAINHVGDSTSGGILANGAITNYLYKYSQQLGFTFRGYGRGGESTDSMMAYLGCGGMILKDSLTIPASGSVTFTPKSSLIDANGKLMYFSSFSQFSNSGSRVSIENVTIGGIAGTISAYQSTRMAGIVLYNSSDYAVLSYTQDDYATDITGLSVSNATKMRVCINARSADEVSNSSCHVSINGTAIDLISHINIANTYLDTNGGLVSDTEGFYTSEEIDISSLGTITNLYIDGLATNTLIQFTRTESGNATIVEKGTRVIAETYELGKSGVITAYINNFRKTGKDIADDWSEQMHRILEYSDDKKFILGSSHYFGNDYTADEIEKIEGRLKTEFGENYFSGYEYLKDCGLQDVVKYGVLTQAQVEDAIANGNQNLPSWQRPFQNETYSDFLHFNSYAAYLIARKFITIGINLGYWEEKDYSYDTLKS